MSRLKVNTLNPTMCRLMILRLIIVSIYTATHAKRFCHKCCHLVQSVFMRPFFQKRISNIKACYPLFIDIYCNLLYFLTFWRSIFTMIAIVSVKTHDIQLRL